MKLIPDWHVVLRRAWSIRLMVVAAALSGAEVILPYIAPDAPSGLFAIASALVTAGAFYARLVAQKGVTDAD